MSEYQYYEWQTIDRPLTKEEQAEVEELSSHIEVTPTRAYVEYHWSDFKHDPREVLARYFDAFLYWANWGTLSLMFRFPPDADLTGLEPYLVKDFVSSERIEGVQVFAIDLDMEGGLDWGELGGELSSFVRLRDDILQGDYRLPYLAWLMAISYHYNPDELLDNPEPPVPAGLRHLNAALSNFAGLFAIDDDLLKAAAKASPKLQTIRESDLRQALSQLSRAECDEFLLRMIKGEAGINADINQRLRAYLPRLQNQALTQRTVRQLLDEAGRMQG